MTREELSEILRRYESGLANPEERAFVESWYNQASEQAEPVQMSDTAEERMQVSWQQLMTPVKARKTRLYLRYVAVAAAMLAIASGIWFFAYHEIASVPDPEEAYASDIAPGKQGATLTLANGKKILLSSVSNEELAKQTGMKVLKPEQGTLAYAVYPPLSALGATDAYHTLSTARGETYRVGLPDGSIVWLNAASSLKYPASFVHQDKRKVILTGEGYFEVAKDKTRPFVVETAGQQVEVLGTHFNVNAYSDEPAVSTTLLEGSVKVRYGNKQEVLQPGFRALTGHGSISIAKANVETITDWKDGDFNLEGLDFKVAMRKIARWYDVEVIYDQAVSDNIVSGGWISRDTKLSTILEVIERSGLARFRLEGRKLYIFPQ